MINTCDKCNHIESGCDENCCTCMTCYRELNIEICSQICDCITHLDSGHMFMDTNHPDDMYGTHIMNERIK